MTIITGTNGDEQYPRELEGTAAADQIYGLAGRDVLIGFGGNDLLEGGKDADELFGSDGFDTASYASSRAGVTVVLSSSYVFGGDAAGDQLYGIEGLRGSAYADILSGDDLRNVLDGGAGADSLNGHEGNDKLVGGGGNDRLFGGRGADELRGDAGSDVAYYGMSNEAVQVDLATGRGFGGDAEGDRLTGVENIVGSILNDRLAGDAGANRLDGDLGADVLIGRGGADRFDYDYTYFSTRADADRILDFSRSQGDKIDLSGIDATAQAGDGNTAFQFIGQKQFTAVGQVRWFQQGGDTIVEANTTNVTAGAELRIVLDPLVSLQSTDFIL